MAEQESVKIDINCDTKQAFVYTEPTMDTVTDRFVQVVKVSEEAAATLKALCEVMDVDPIAMKQRMVMNALKNDGKGYPGDLYTDALEVIGTLIHARDRYKDELESAKNANFTVKKNCAEAMKECDRLGQKIHRAECSLEMPHFILGKFEEKRKYTNQDVISAQIDVMDQARDHYQQIYKILTEDSEK
jgi:hypothetical protein